MSSMLQLTMTAPTDIILDLDSDLPKSSSYGEPTALIYLVRTFTFFSWICLFPFQIKWSGRENRYNLIQFSRFRKGLCLLSNLGGCLMTYALFRLVSDLSSVIMQESLIIFILAVLLFVLMFLTLMSLFYVLWFAQDKILSIANLFASPKLPLKRSAMPSPFVYLVPSCLIFPLILSMSQRTPERYSREVGSRLGTKCVTYLLISFLSLEPSEIESSLVIQIFLGGFTAFIKLIVGFGTIYVIAHMFIFLFLTLSLRKMGRHIQLIFERELITVRRALLIHNQLLTLSKEVSSVFGTLAFASYVAHLIYIVQIPLWWVFSLEDDDGNGGVSANLNDKAYGVIFMVIWAIVWWAAGDWHRIIHSTFTNWSQNRILSKMTIEEHLQLISLYNSLQTNQVALACPFFAITLRLICQTCGVLLTYGIIVLQILTPTTRKLFYELQRNVIGALIEP